MKFNCDECLDTGWVGDNGAGIKGNIEYEPCQNCEKPIVKTVNLDALVSLPTIAEERYLKDCISFPIANKFKTHPESIPDVVAEIYTALKEKFEFVRRKAT